MANNGTAAPYKFFRLKPERLAADTAYGSAANLNWLVNEKQIAPHIPVIDKSKREDGTFSREDFTFDKARDIYSRPAGKVLTTTGKIVNDDLLLYRASKSIATPARSRCNAARRSRLVRSRAASMKVPVTLLVGSPAYRPSSSRAVTASASRCCLPISSAS